MRHLLNNTLKQKTRDINNLSVKSLILLFTIALIFGYESPVTGGAKVLH
jgi:hypothetical protein